MHETPANLVFRVQLSQFVALGTPFAKAVTCLESTHSTAGDVYLIWCGIGAELQELFDATRFNIPKTVKEEVMAIFNRRFQQIFVPTPTKKSEKLALKAGAKVTRLPCGPHMACFYLNPGRFLHMCHPFQH
jgi:hypothetical protein